MSASGGEEPGAQDQRRQQRRDGGGRHAGEREGAAAEAIGRPPGGPAAGETARQPPSRADKQQRDQRGQGGLSETAWRGRDGGQPRSRFGGDLAQARALRRQAGGGGGPQIGIERRIAAGPQPGSEVGAQARGDRAAGLIGLHLQELGLLQLGVDLLAIVEKGGAGRSGFRRLRRLAAARRRTELSQTSVEIGELWRQVGDHAAHPRPYRRHLDLALLQARLVGARRQAGLLDRSQLVLRLIDDRRLARERIGRRLGVRGAGAIEG